VHLPRARGRLLAGFSFVANEKFKRQFVVGATDAPVIRGYGGADKDAMIERVSDTGRC
jgi:hypothetical protein